MHVDFFQPKLLRHLPQRVAAQLEAFNNGMLRVIYGGTSWRFKLLVLMGQTMQVSLDQMTTISDDSSVTEEHEAKVEIDSVKEMFDETTWQIVQEYCRLSKLSNPSSKELERTLAILELAQYDLQLTCLINEADHLIAYELGLVDDLLPNEGESSKDLVSEERHG